MENYLCPDGVEEWYLENTMDDVYSQFGRQGFYFAVDTCKNFQKYTNSETCVDNDDVEEVVDTFTVHSKVSQEFFSASTYAGND